MVRLRCWRSDLCRASWVAAHGIVSSSMDLSPQCAGGIFLCLARVATRDTTQRGCLTMRGSETKQHAAVTIQTPRGSGRWRAMHQNKTAKCPTAALTHSGQRRGRGPAVAVGVVRSRTSRGRLIGLGGIPSAGPWHRHSLYTGSGGPDSAKIHGRLGDVMRPDDHSKEIEAGFFSSSR